MPTFKTRLSQGDLVNYVPTRGGPDTGWHCPVARGKCGDDGQAFTKMLPKSDCASATSNLHLNRLPPRSPLQWMLEVLAMKKWTRWQDWVGVAAGIVAAVSTTWLDGTSTSMTLMLVFGLLMVVTGVWSVMMPRLVSMEWALAIASALLFASPWMGSFTDFAGAAWMSWICGGVGIVAGLLALSPAMELHHAAGGSRMAH